MMHLKSLRYRMPWTLCMLNIVCLLACAITRFWTHFAALLEQYCLGTPACQLCEPMDEHHCQLFLQMYTASCIKLESTNNLIFWKLDSKNFYSTQFTNQHLKILERFLIEIGPYASSTAMLICSLASNSTLCQSLPQTLNNQYAHISLV